MLPSNSNLSKENCSSISSNCVIWQGPDISCINLCTGDSISDVTYKLAEEICILKKDIGVSDVDLTCLVRVCQQSVEPTKTLSNILGLLINKVCCLSDIIKTFPTPTPPYQEPVLSYPVCAIFSSLDPNDLHSDFTENLAKKICELSVKVSENTADINDHEARIDDLESKFPIPKDRLASCLLATVEDYDIILKNLETEFCDLIDALGDDTALTTAVGTSTTAIGCTNLKDQKSLIDSNRTMGSLLNWNTVPQNFAESVENLWITVCDMRAAVRSILDNCCKAGCDDILIDFYFKWSKDDDGVLLLNFRAKSKLPVGFYDCGQNPSSPNTGINVFDVTDSLGVTIPLPVVPAFRSINYPTDTSGWLDDPQWSYGWVEIDMNQLGIDLDAGPILFEADLCFTDGTIECIKCVSFTIPPKPANKCCEIKATKDTTIVYVVCN